VTGIYLMTLLARATSTVRCPLPADFGRQSKQGSTKPEAIAANRRAWRHLPSLTYGTQERWRIEGLQQ
jgi:hypothetical protein